MATDLQSQQPVRLVPGDGPILPDVVRSEFTKFRTVRSTYATLVAAFVAAAATARRSPCSSLLSNCGRRPCRVGVPVELDAFVRRLHKRLLERSELWRKLVQRDPGLASQVANHAHRYSRHRESTVRFWPRLTAARGDRTDKLFGLRRAHANEVCALRSMNSSTEVSATSRPRPITMRWSAVSAISLIRWLETKIVRPSAASERSSWRTHLIPSGSKPFTGSSNNITPGSPSSAAAIPSLWLMPSEKPPARLRATEPRPTRSMTLSTRLRGMPLLWARDSKW